MHARPLRAGGYICFSAVWPAGPTPSQLHGPTPAPPAWMGPEGPRSSRDCEGFGSDYRLFEDDIIAGVPKISAQFYTPYTCIVHDMREDGTAEPLRSESPQEIV